jgi:hypothetical protein
MFDEEAFPIEEESDAGEKAPASSGSTDEK